MELWNNHDEFRKEYMSSNMRSTLRRLRTLDGRALGPDEQPPIIPSVVSRRVAKANVAPSAPVLEVEKLATPVETQKIDEKSTTKLGDKKKPNVIIKKQANPASLENGLPTVSGRDQIEESRHEENKPAKEEESRQENKLTKEEVELARKTEELRKEKEEAKLKEQRRFEEKAKAKEAMERKKRNAEKAQARASLRAQREAEQKEKVNSKKQTNSYIECGSNPGQNLSVCYYLVVWLSSLVN